MIYIASDHGGFDLKNKITQYLISRNFEVEDIGPHNYNPTDDYPDYAIPLAHKVKEHPENRGVLICRNGVGMCLATNKISGVRCGISWNPPHAISSKRDDNTNVLAIPADYITENEAINTVEAWLTSSFSAEERHIRRLDKVAKLEK